MKNKPEVVRMTHQERNRRRMTTLRRIKKNWILYLFLVPMLLYIALFCYAPMYGIQIAFKNFSPGKGIWGSTWVGFKWFERFFNLPRFWPILKNTLTVSVYSLICDFPLPIVLALILHNVANQKWKRFAQTLVYMPHFISTIVVVGMLSMFLSPRSGIINTLLGFLGGSGDTYFLGIPEAFPHIYVWSGVWQSIGWGSIIYLAALTGVDPNLHEAVEIDGANKLQRIFYIDLPSIMPTMAILLIMRCGSIMSVGYEKVYLLQNSLNLQTSEVISTYVYKQGLVNREYSYATAVGLANSVINFITVVLANKVVGKLTDSSLW